MTACEKCWGDAYMRMINNPERSQAEHYRALLDERKDNPCTLEQQIGQEAVETLAIRLSLSGDKWQAQIGENLLDGVTGHGNGPVSAIRDLCDNFAANPYEMQRFTLQ